MGACASDIARARAPARNRRCPVRIRARLRRPVAGGAMLGLGAGDRVPVHRTRRARLDRRCRRGAAHGLLDLAHASLRVDRCGRARDRERALRHLAARALPPRDPRISRHGGQGNRLATSWRRPTRRPPGTPLYLFKNLPWFAWPALPLVLWTIFTRGRGFNGGLATAGVQLSATLALVIGGAIVAMADPRLVVLMPLLAAAHPARGARDRHACRAASPVRSTGSAFSPSVFFPCFSGGMWFDAHAQGMPASIARLFRDTEPGYRPSFHWAAFSLSLFLTALWLALVRPARRSNRRALLNWAAGMTLLWALYSTIWLPYLDSRRSYRVVAESLRAAAAERGLRREPQPGRRAARAVQVFRRPRHRTRGNRSDRALQRRCWSSRAAARATRGARGLAARLGGAAPWRRYRALRPLPAEGAMKFIDEVDDRGHRRRRRQRLGVVPAREVRAARRPRRRRRRPRRQHLSRSPIATSTR